MENTERRDLKEIVDEIARTTHCPVCGAELKVDKWWIADHYGAAHVYCPNGHI